MINLTRPQREALRRVHQRIVEAQKPSARPMTYMELRLKVAPGPGCVMVPYAGMWLGIEPDGYTHS